MGSEIRSVYERGGPALANTLEYGPGSVPETLFHPEKLSPKQRLSVAERLGVKGPIGGLLNTLSDPFTAAAVIATFVFPIPTTGNLRKLAQKFRGFEAEGKGGTSLFHPFQSGHSLFKNTPIAEYLTKIESTLMQFYAKHGEQFAEAIQKYEKATGRNFERGVDDLVLGAFLDGLHKTTPQGFQPKFSSKMFLDGPALAEWRGNKHFMTLVDEFRSIRGKMWEDIALNPKSRATLEQSLRQLSRETRSRWERQTRTILEAEGKTPQEIQQTIKERLAKLPNPEDDQVWKEFMDSTFRDKKYYLNHVAVKNDPAGLNSRMFEEYLGEMDKLRNANLDQYVESALFGRAYLPKAVPSGKIPGFVKPREGKMLPYADDVRRLAEAGLISPTTLGEYKELVGANNFKDYLRGREGPSPIGMYTMSAFGASADYIHQGGKLAAWTLSGTGQKVLEEYHKLGNDPASRGIKAALEDVYIPALVGNMSRKAYMRAAKWHELLEGTSRMFDSEPVRKVLGGKTAERLRDAVLRTRGVPLMDYTTRRISSYLYTGALGGNFASSFRNLFQLVLTSGPLLGPEAMARGVGSYISRSKTMLAELGRTKNLDKAFEKAFPEYAKSGIPASVILDDSFYRIRDSLDVGGAPSYRKMYGKLSNFLMFPFSMSEKTVRAVTFEAARLKSLKEFSKMDTALFRREAEPLARLIGKDVNELTKSEAAIHHAGAVVDMTQFPGGLVNTPKWFINKGPLTRQFAHFLSRYTEYVMPGGTAARALRPTHYRLPWTGLTQHEFQGGLGPSIAGTVSAMGRMYLWSKAASTAALNLAGVDLDESLMTGALPLPRENGPLGVLPFQPPAYSIVAGGISDIMSGEFDQSRYSLPLLVPGGVALARGVGAVPGGAGAAQFLNRQYVDYDRQGPDGTYPVYSGKGAMIGYMTPGQIALMGTGLMEKGQAIQTEQDLSRMLLKNREKIIGMKQQFVEALLNNQTAVYNSIDEQYQAQYGRSIRTIVKKSDLDKARLRKDVTRAERMLDTLPAAVRPQFQQAIQMLMLSNPDLLGVEPAGWEYGRTVKSRTPWRHRPQEAAGTVYEFMPYENLATPPSTGQGVGGGNISGAQSDWRNQMGPFGSMNPYDISQEGRRNQTRQAGAGGGFDSFSVFGGY